MTTAKVTFLSRRGSLRAAVAIAALSSPVLADAEEAIVVEADGFVSCASADDLSLVLWRGDTQRRNGNDRLGQ